MDSAHNSHSKFLTPWAEKSGCSKPLLMNMAMTVDFYSCGIVFYFFGSTQGGVSQHSQWH
jgi:hypothetical protein